MKNRIACLVLFIAGACAIASCATYSKVSEKRPRYHSIAGGSGALAAAEAKIINALRVERRDPLAALGEYLTATKIASGQLERSPNDVNALHDYNFAVARIIAVIRDAKLDPWTQPLRVPASGGDYVLSHKPDPRPRWNPALYTFTPADQFDVHGTYVTKRTTRTGLGAPVVAVERELNEDARADFALPRVYYGVTAVARFDGLRCLLSFEDPLSVETIQMNGHSYTLAADFTVPLAVMLASTNPKKLELSRLLNPAKYAETARISRLQPYDPNKAVVLVIHGLMDSPATWTPMLNSLRGDADIRRNYQFWFYSYPSGYPYPYSASILRRELDAAKKRFPLRKPMVVIGHSMGGCISRLLITDTDRNFWIKLFNKPPEKTSLSPGAREIFTESLIFRHRPEIGRVIFISAPLRGSDLASHWIGRLGSRLVRAPSTLLGIGSVVLQIGTLNFGDLKLKRLPNSVDTLAPNNRFVKAINTIPITPGIPYHTIMGDRGKGDAPNSSDGVVSYWSSHMEGAQSELIVPAGHPAHQNLQAIEEVRRILKLNARSSANHHLHDVARSNQ